MSVIFLYLVLAVLVGMVARVRGRSGGAWFLISLFITPLLGGLIVMALPRLVAALPHRARLGESITTRDAPDTGLWGSLAFWIAMAFSSLLVAFTMINYLWNVSRGYPFLSLFPLLLAGIIALVGLLFRKLSTSDA